MDTAIRHQAAISLSNAAVWSMSSKGSYQDALVTLRDSIRIIKSCIVDTTDIDNQHSILSPEEINHMVRQGFQRLEGSSSMQRLVVPSYDMSPENEINLSIDVATDSATDQQQPPIYLQALSSKQSRPSASRIFQAETGSREMALSSLILLSDTALSTSFVRNVCKPKLFLYPMIIDDDAMYNLSENDMYNHHSIILLYNYGIVHQCLAFVEQCVPKASSGKNFIEASNQFQKYMSAAHRIFLMIFQSLNEQVQPLRLLDLINGESKTCDIDTSMSRKYLPMMILINYSMILSSDAMQLQTELNLHCNMLDKLLFLVSAFEWNYFTDRFDTAVAA